MPAVDCCARPAARTSGNHHSTRDLMPVCTCGSPMALVDICIWGSLGAQACIAVSSFLLPSPTVQESGCGANYRGRRRGGGGDIPCGGKYESTNSGMTKSVPLLKNERTNSVRFPIIAHEKQWALAVITWTNP